VVLLVVPGDTPGRVGVLAVDPACGTAHSSALTSTVVPRP
jgi:hypothetical protein